MRTPNTTRKLVKAIGAEVLVRFEDILVICTVVDSKVSYGEVRLQVMPVMGNGSQWITLGRVKSVAIDGTFIGRELVEIR